MTTESQYARFGSGKSVLRVEDESLLTGAGYFADDATLPDQACVMFLRSPHPHARITAIDTAAAAALPGVIAIVTGEDLVRARVKPIPLSADFKRSDGSPTFTPLVCIGLMVFYVLAMQCISTVANVRRETNTWFWPLFQIAYMTVLAWLGAFVVYQGGRLLGFT